MENMQSVTPREKKKATKSSEADYFIHINIIILHSFKLIGSWVIIIGYWWKNQREGDH
jgi:hypothetical protein